MKPLVSILIPAYNAEGTLAETVQSALAQTWQNREIIIVNDGSRDNTLEIAKSFAGPRVSVVTQENVGAARTRNKAYSLCQGDYIQWLDADDLLNPQKIDSQMALLESGEGKRTLLSSGWAYFRYRPHAAEFIPTDLWSDLSPIEWMTRKMEQNLHMQTATWLVSRELSEAAGPWNGELLGDDDGEYFARVLMASDRVRFAREGKVFYRISPTSRLSYIGRSQKKLDAQFHSMELNIRYIRSLEDTPRVRAACVKYLQTWLPHFYPECEEVVDRARALAKELGGELEAPRISWKYRWLQALFGWSFAKRAQVHYNQWKASALRMWDRTLLRLEARRTARPNL